jgi:hypothetical protein
MYNEITSGYELLGILTVAGRTGKPVNIVLDAYDTFTKGVLSQVHVDGEQRDRVIHIEGIEEDFFLEDVRAIRINGTWFNTSLANR